jgi:hypothetical protein
MSLYAQPFKLKKKKKLNTQEGKVLSLWMTSESMKNSPGERKQNWETTQRKN